MKQKKGIRNKLTNLIVLITVAALVLSSCCSFAVMLNMRKKSLETATNDTITQIAELSKSRASIADSMLTLAQNQTLLVADGAKNLISNSDKYLQGYNEENLLKLTCDDAKAFAFALVPEEHLTDIQTDVDGKVVSAKIVGDTVMESGLSVNQQLYLGSLLINEFQQIERFKTPGTENDYKGFAASYFCFDDSGIDMLGDPKLANSIVSYDGRTRGWYKGAVEAYNNGTLTESGVYWTEPVADGAGRGMSMVCSTPVVIDGKIVGVAGSGGLINDFSELVQSSTVGSTGFSLMVSRNSSKVIINPNDSKEAESDVSIGTDMSVSDNASLNKLAQDIKNGESGQTQKITVDGKECYVAYSALKNNDWTMITLISTDDDLIMDNYRSLNRQIGTAFIMFFVLVVLIIVVVASASTQFSKNFTKPFIMLKEGVDEIGAGHWDRELDIKTGDEIEDLGNAFNAMAKNLDSHVKRLTAVTAEKERIGAELDVAAHIQSSMLPCIFPAFPDRKEIDIYATMDPAKEVGGDFYDFFMIDEKHIAIVVADVSGKGIPAALFMVIGKTLIKDHTQEGTDLGEVFSTVNNLLCESNSEGLFITAFEGVLDLETGEFTFVNAGHEMPFIAQKGADFAPYQIKPGFVLAGMEDMRYRSGRITLEPGDKIFQYTDGVTEATDSQNQLYGMERLQNVLLKCKDKTPQEILPAVKEDIDKFVGEAPQFDDITMLCLEFKEKMNVQ